jgi:DNA modification methylase
MSSKIEINNIYQGDTLELILEMESNSVDLIVCDGPYGVTSYDWDKIPDIQTFNLNLIKLFSRVLKPGGALYLFGKEDCIDFIDYRPYLTLNRKIIWYQPSRLAQGRLNYTNNYDLIAYFSKGKAKTFNLDEIRVPQLVELEHRRRCENVPSVVNGAYGKTKFNEDGKNPGDVWGDIKQLTYKSKELISRELLNTIQKPEKLIDRIIKASSNEGDVVLDPFSGVGTTYSVCKKLNRNFIGFEIEQQFVELTENRIKIVELEKEYSLF